MMIEKLDITRENGSLHGQLKFVDGDLSKEDYEEMVSRLISWKLGPVMPTRHFEMAYNSKNEETRAEVFVSISEHSNSQIDSLTYVFNKLMEFLKLYEREFTDITGL